MIKEMCRFGWTKICDGQEYLYNSGELDTCLKSYAGLSAFDSVVLEVRGLTSTFELDATITGRRVISTTFFSDFGRLRQLGQHSKEKDDLVTRRSDGLWHMDAKMS